MRWRPYSGLIGLVVALSGCGSDVARGSPASGEGACTPGTSRACACPDGTQGVSVCRQVGNGYLPCDCSGGGGGGGSDVPCAPGTASCDNDPANGCETNTDSDVGNCGACGAACGSDHGAASCTAGACSIVCDPGSGDCDADAATGCETALSALGSCGGCGVTCPTSCSTGACLACDDTGPLLDSLDPADAVKAIGLCAGLVSAAWVVADGAPPPTNATELANFHLGHGILPDFGPNNHPQQGANLLGA